MLAVLTNPTPPPPMSPQTNPLPPTPIPPPPSMSQVDNNNMFRVDNNMFQDQESNKEVMYQVDQMLKEWSLKRFQLRAESSTSHLRRNTLSTTRCRELRESHMKEKLLNTKRSSTAKEFQLKGPSQTTMQLKPKLNTSPRKLNRLLLNTNPSKGLGKEFNISLLKLKLSTTQNEKNMLPDKEENTFKLAMLTRTKLSQGETIELKHMLLEEDLITSAEEVEREEDRQ